MTAASGLRHLKVATDEQQIAAHGHIVIDAPCQHERHWRLADPTRPLGGSEHDGTTGLSYAVPGGSCVIACRVHAEAADEQIEQRRGHLPDLNNLARPIRSGDRFVGDDGLVWTIVTVLERDEVDRLPAGHYEPGACETCGRRDGLHDAEECFK